jgi:DNA polymerase-1
VENKNQLENLKRKIEDKKQTVVDIETETLDGKIVGLSFCLEAGSAYYLPVGDKFKLVDIEDVLKSSRIKKIGHGLKYDYRLLLENGIELKNLYFDTMIAAYLLDPERRNYKLDRLVFNELGQEMIPLTDLMGEDHQTKLSQVEVEKIKDYSCEDSDMSYRLYQLYNSRLEEKNLSQLFNQIEMPLVAILAKMESLGIKVSKEKLLKLKDKLEREIEENKKQVKDLVGTDFNLDSPLQLREILFDRLEISSQGVSKTKTGLSTSASELNKIKNRHPVVELILKHRQMEKIRNTYVVPLLERNEERIKTNFNQVVAATGRLSSSDPNLQNIPARSELAQEVRKVFRAQKGFKLVSLDYSQIELRVAAHLSGDRAMIEAFKQGQDIHQATAAKLFDLSLSQVKPEQRDQAKTINFAVLYGMSPYGLAQSLETDRDYAKQFIDNYFKNFSGVKKYLDNIVKEAQEKGYVETLFGRRRYFNLDRSRQLKRAAINTPIQGTAADLMKKAMINIDKKINLANNLKEKDKPRMLLQVHDELIFEIKNNQTAEFSAKVKKIMEEVVRLKVPLKVDLKIGPSWGELEKKDV